MRAIRLAAARRVFEHDDAIAFGLPCMVVAVADALGHPDAAVLVDVDIRRIMEHRRRRPQRDLETVRHAEDVERHANRRLSLDQKNRRADSDEYRSHDVSLRGDVEDVEDDTPVRDAALACAVILPCP